jgi:UDP-N-acetylmuramate--alanine ligase
VLSAAREAATARSSGDGGGARVIALVQPHRFTRLRDLMEEFQNAFNDADLVFVAPVYPAGEEPIEGVDAAALAEGLRAHGHRMARTVGGLDEVCAALRDLVADGDLIICMGAGDITKWAAKLADGICAERERK